MPPRMNSRHSFTWSYQMSPSDNRRFLVDREPFLYQDRQDNIIHIVNSGDTLWSLAGKYYRGVPRPNGLWWVIADYQPQPIRDPTLKIPDGTVLVLPSIRVLREEIFSERRRISG
jgi:hypothetical protein